MWYGWYPAGLKDICEPTNSAVNFHPFETKMLNWTKTTKFISSVLWAILGRIEIYLWDPNLTFGSQSLEKKKLILFFCFFKTSRLFRFVIYWPETGQVVQCKIWALYLFIRNSPHGFFVGPPFGPHVVCQIGSQIGCHFGSEIGRQVGPQTGRQVGPLLDGLGSSWISLLVYCLEPVVKHGIITELITNKNREDHRLTWNLPGLMMMIVENFPWNMIVWNVIFVEK